MRTGGQRDLNQPCFSFCSQERGSGYSITRAEQVLPRLHR
jgi:hypothetical protein